MITYKDLEQFGLSEKEAKIYLAVLELGATTATKIAYETGVNRTTTYFAIESMIKIGLISTFEKEKTTLFSAESPMMLKHILMRREEQFKTSIQLFENFLPELLKIYEYAEEKPKVRYYEGKEGLMSIFENFLNSKTKTAEEFYSSDDLCAIFSVKENEERLARRIKKKIFLRALYTQKYVKMSRPMTERRIIPQDLVSFESDILLYDDVVVIISLHEKPNGIVIHNKKITRTIRSLFNLAWNQAEKYQ